LRKRGQRTAVGDEGGFAPDLGSPEAALDLLCQAIEKTGRRPGEDVALALDVAASELRDGQIYGLQGEKVSTEQIIERWSAWRAKYPIVSIEDGLAEDDWDGWKRLTERLGKRTQIVGDDLLCTNPKLIRRAVGENSCNALLVKVNQIGTLTETLEAIATARNAGWTTVISHRSGETEDTFIADLAVATNAGQIKTGSASRSDRVAKYNRLLRIAEELGTRARFAGRAVLRA
jgi:enolase